MSSNFNHWKLMNSNDSSIYKSNDIEQLFYKFIVSLWVKKIYSFSLFNKKTWYYSLISSEHMEPTCELRATRILGWSIGPSSTSWCKKMIYLSHKIIVHGPYLWSKVEPFFKCRIFHMFFMIFWHFMLKLIRIIFNLPEIISFIT